MEEALLGAAHYGDLGQLVEIIETSEVSVNVCDVEMTTALMLACVGGHLDCVEVLIDMGAFIDFRRQTGCTALFLASQCGHYDIVEYLLCKGAMIDSQNNNGGTALFVASQMGYLDIVELLCCKGANVHLSLKDRTTPVFVASQNGYPEIVRVLRRHHADINCRRGDGTSPLWIACQTNQLGVVETLLDLGADVDRPRNIDGITPLFKAASKGYKEIVSTLLTRSPYLGLHKSGYTPLHAAAYFGHLGVTKVLLECGASPYVKDRTGQDAAELAAEQGFEEVSKTIHSYQATTY